MKRFLFLLITLFSLTVKSQTIQQIDSLNNQICKSFDKLEKLDKSIFQEILQKHMPDFFNKYRIDSKAKSDSLMDLVYFRLQKSCDSFIKLLSKIEDNKSDWVTLDTQSKTNVSESDLKKFFSHSKFHYKEYDGKIVKVKMLPNLWEEKFENGSFSKLELKTTTESTFILKFIESNNEMRKNLSVKGEEYHYGIYDKGENYYSIWTLSNEGKYYAFKLYLD